MPSESDLKFTVMKASFSLKKIERMKKRNFIISAWSVEREERLLCELNNRAFAAAGVDYLKRLQ